MYMDKLKKNISFISNFPIIILTRKVNNIETVIYGKLLDYNILTNKAFYSCCFTFLYITYIENKVESTCVYHKSFLGEICSRV